MGLVQDKLAKYDLPQQYMAMGVYPYFRTIDSHQDTEVLMDIKTQDIPAVLIRHIREGHLLIYAFQ